MAHILTGSFQVQSIDMKVVADTTIIPAAAGKRFIPLLGTFHFRTLTGATGNPTIKIVHGAAGGFDLLVSSAIDRAVYPVDTQYIMSLGTGSEIHLIDLTNPVLFKVTSGGTGTTLTGQVDLFGIYF